MGKQTRVKMSKHKIDHGMALSLIIFLLLIGMMVIGLFGCIKIEMQAPVEKKKEEKEETILNNPGVDFTQEDLMLPEFGELIIEEQPEVGRLWHR